MAPLALGEGLRTLLGGMAEIEESKLVAALERAGAFTRALAFPPGASPALSPTSGAQPRSPARLPASNARLQVSASRPVAKLWALAKAASEQPIVDPWDVHLLWERPTELCVRYDYNARTRAWSRSETLVKMGAAPFGKGAMRECYRMKKMSQFNPVFFYRMDWRHCSNYVAKRYMAGAVGPSSYLADVQMQAEAKLWASRYNRLQPPKQVDFLTAFCLEFPNRPRPAAAAADAAEEAEEAAACAAAAFPPTGGGAFFGVERLIEGEYRKYNGNSGFVGADHRSTPHAFSLFTFRASRGRLMVVDIQGVADLFTDPQVHTADGLGYGDGNLGVHGMALFLASLDGDDNHAVASLGLRPLPLAPSEKLRATAAHALGADAAAAVVAGSGAGSATAAGAALIAALSEAARREGSSGASASYSSSQTAIRSPLAPSPFAPGGGSDAAPPALGATMSARLHLLLEQLVHARSRSLSQAPAGADDGDGAAARAFELSDAAVEALPWARLGEAIAELARARALDHAPACAAAEAARTDDAAGAAGATAVAAAEAAVARAERQLGARQDTDALEPTTLGAGDGQSLLDADEPEQSQAGEAALATAEAKILAQIHLALAKLNYTGTAPGMAANSTDLPAAAFHLLHAAAAADADAVRDVLALCRGMPSSLLPDLKFQNEDAARARAVLELAGWQGDRYAALELADGCLVSASAADGANAAAAREAARWLRHALATAAERGGWDDDADADAEGNGAAAYQLHAKLGEALEIATDWAAAADAFEAAAEGAMARSRGKLSFRYAERAEATRAHVDGESDAE